MSKQSFTLAELAGLIGAEYQGDGTCIINGVSTLESAQSGQLAFLENPKLRKHLATTNASVVILSPKDAKDCPTNAIIVQHPHLIYAKLATLFSKAPKRNSGIHPSAIVGENCEIDPSVYLGPNCVIGNSVILQKNVIIEAGCVIGDNCFIGMNSKLWANVTIYYDCSIGENCAIHSGVVIGADGFGHIPSADGWLAIPQLGGVKIGNKVEIGANTTIDRGAIDDTIIEDGVILDNQIQIGHNVRIGANTAIAGCVGIAGSVVIGKNCMIGGAAGFAGHLEIADNVVITGMTGISKSITKAGVYSAGVRAAPRHQWKKNALAFEHLAELADRVKNLEKN